MSYGINHQVGVKASAVAAAIECLVFGPERARWLVAALHPSRAARHVPGLLGSAADKLPALHQRRCVQHKE